MVSENSVPHCTHWLMIIIPVKNGYFIGNINPTFSDKPTCQTSNSYFAHVITPSFPGLVDFPTARREASRSALQDEADVPKRPNVDLRERSRQRTLSSQQSIIYDHMCIYVYIYIYIYMFIA